MSVCFCRPSRWTGCLLKVLLKADCTLEATSACTSISPCVYYRNVLRVVKLCIICTVWYISVHQQSIVSVSSRFHFGSAHRSMGSQVASTRRIDTPLRATHGLRSAGGAHGRGTRVNITGTFFAAGVAEQRWQNPRDPVRTLRTTGCYLACTTHVAMLRDETKV